MLGFQPKLIVIGGKTQLTEFQRDSDATENLKSRTAFTYDALNRLTGSTRRLEVYPYDTLAYTYTYDTLGNLLKQSGPTKGEEDWRKRF